MIASEARECNFVCSRDAERSLGEGEQRKRRREERARFSKMRHSTPGDEDHSSVSCFLTFHSLSHFCSVSASVSVTLWLLRIASL